MSESFIYGSRRARARTVLIYGNCQTPYLGRMLAALDDLNDDYRFVVALNHAPAGASEAPRVDPDSLRDVALILWQYEDRLNNPAAAAVQQILPATAPIVRFPTYVLKSLWPFECPDPRSRPEPGYPWSRFPNGDSIGLEVAARGLRGALAVEAYLERSLAMMPDLQERYERDVERMYRHEAHCDVRLSDAVIHRFRHEHMFWTNAHVSCAAVVELAARVADAARPVLGGSYARALAAFRRAADFEGMDRYQHPVHPLVAESFALRYGGPDYRWDWYGRRWTFFEYIERYIAYDRDW
jgi:hypothetical protein